MIMACQPVQQSQREECGRDPPPGGEPESEPPDQERSPMGANRHFSITRQVRLDVHKRALLDFNLDNHFRDPDGDALSYTATSSHPDIVRTVVKGNTLTIGAIEGSIFRITFRIITITVTADDGKGGTVSTEFGVTVSNDEALDEVDEFVKETAIEACQRIRPIHRCGKSAQGAWRWC